MPCVVTFLYHSKNVVGIQPLDPPPPQFSVLGWGLPWRLFPVASEHFLWRHFKKRYPGRKDCSSRLVANLLACPLGPFMVKSLCSVHEAGRAGLESSCSASHRGPLGSTNCSGRATVLSTCTSACPGFYLAFKSSPKPSPLPQGSQHGTQHTGTLDHLQGSTQSCRTTWTINKLMARFLLWGQGLTK